MLLGNINNIIYQTNFQLIFLSFVVFWLANGIRWRCTLFQNNFCRYEYFIGVWPIFRDLDFNHVSDTSTTFTSFPSPGPKVRLWVLGKRWSSCYVFSFIFSVFRSFRALWNILCKYIWSYIKHYKKDLKSEENVVLLNPKDIEDGYYIESGWASVGNEVEVPGVDSLWQVKGNRVLSEKNNIVSLFVWPNKNA